MACCTTITTAPLNPGGGGGGGQKRSSGGLFDLPRTPKRQRPFNAMSTSPVASTSSPPPAPVAPSFLTAGSKPADHQIDASSSSSADKSSSIFKSVPYNQFSSSVIAASSSSHHQSSEESSQQQQHPNDVPLFSVNQVNQICERMLREHEQSIREQYDKILAQKLSEQYDAFVKFTHEQLQRRFDTSQCSYVS